MNAAGTLAAALCAAYALDAEQQKAKVETWATRARAFEADGTEPPGEIEDD